MKKIGILLVYVALILSFWGCEKDNLGYYNPKLKIQQIYEETNGHYLKERWIWNGDLLTRIDFYRKNGDIQYSHTYSYDKDRLARIDADGQYTEFLYDKNTLTTINTYVGNQLAETYKLSYNGKKLSQMQIAKEGKGMSMPAFNMLSHLMPDYYPMMCSQLSSNSKGENYNFSAATVDFVWEGDNIQYMKMKVNRPDSVQKITFTYMYDDQINPQNHFFPLLLDHSLLNDNPRTLFCSKNNATSVHVTKEQGFHSQTEAFTYAYDYYKKYPTKVYKTYFDRITMEEKKELLFTYQYW